ncbi:DUF7504 family protein [Halovenus halobia]|uniref:DUF7504 family protein n=1 Tax=Halovenus halobia TaxID=3396622 RepID=UPI003F573CD4
MSEEYTFPDLPLNPVRPGTTVLVSGPGRPASKLSRRLTLELDEGTEGAVLISTNTSGRSLAREAAGTYPDLDLSRVGIVDATGRGDIKMETDARMKAVSSTSDLTGISINFSILFSALADDGIDRIRACVDSLSLLLLYTKLPTIVRFTHSLGGRVNATDGFGTFVLDPTMHDPQVEYTLGSVCDGVIEVREHEGSYQMRTDGLVDQPNGWQPVDLSP